MLSLNKQYEKCILDNVHKILEEKESVDEWKIFLKKRACFFINTFD